MAGLELLFSSVKSQLNGPEDALVCAFHWCMVSNGFKCIGCGESVSFNVYCHERNVLQLFFYHYSKAKPLLATGNRAAQP